MKTEIAIIILAIMILPQATATSQYRLIQGSIPDNSQIEGTTVTALNMRTEQVNSTTVHDGKYAIYINAEDSDMIAIKALNLTMLVKAGKNNEIDLSPGVDITGYYSYNGLGDARISKLTLGAIITAFMMLITSVFLIKVNWAKAKKKEKR